MYIKYTIMNPWHDMTDVDNRRGSGLKLFDLWSFVVTATVPLQGRMLIPVIALLVSMHIV